MLAYAKGTLGPLCIFCIFLRFVYRYKLIGYVEKRVRRERRVIPYSANIDMAIL